MLVTPIVTLSIVSHGQGALICDLLSDLRGLSDVPFEIILTFNIAEDESFLANYSDLPITVLRNATAKGFGSNHNSAFAVSRGTYFAVVNPDIRFPNPQLQPLINALQLPHVAACAPLVFSARGAIEDSVRKFPTVWRLLSRVFRRRRDPDYQLGEAVMPVDWAAGMFVLFRRDVFRQVDGFDERFYMYYEDADICRRLCQRGWRTVLQPETRVVHKAQRASHRDVRHLSWHVRSVVRYLTGL
jgi:N-acetylglucosaminyl-diphospho-decaprenol L-rhamnosyltransferase